MSENEKEPEKVVNEPPNWESIAKYKAAELDNYIKRNRDSVQNAFNDGRTNVIMGFLPFGDNLGEALKIIKDENDRKGIEVLLRKFEAILVNFGLEEIPVKKGDNFDPYIHSAVAQGETDKNKVLEVLQKGYKFAGRIIRPAMVRI